MNPIRTVFTIVDRQRLTCLYDSLLVCNPEIRVSKTQLKDMLAADDDRKDHVMQSTNVLRAIANCLGPNIILVERLWNGKMNCLKILDVVRGDRWIRGNAKETSRQTFVITYANNHYTGVHGDTISPEEWKLLLDGAEAILWPVSREDEELERAIAESLQTITEVMSPDESLLKWVCEASAQGIL